MNAEFEIELEVINDDEIEIEILEIEKSSEDLNAELKEQDGLITTQKVSLEDVKEALKNRVGGSGKVEDLSEELTEQDELIDYQVNALLEAFTKLQGKTAGGSGGNTLPTIEENTLVFSTGIVEGGVLSV